MRPYITAICVMVVCVFCFAACSLAGEEGYNKFFGDGAKIPSGWSNGEKTGWDGQMLPPGLYAKTPADTRVESEDAVNAETRIENTAPRETFGELLERIERHKKSEKKKKDSEGDSSD
jgi:hypothetical protein